MYTINIYIHHIIGHYPILLYQPDIADPRYHRFQVLERSSTATHQARQSRL
jgi:hypothetical protein